MAKLNRRHLRKLIESMINEQDDGEFRGVGQPKEDRSQMSPDEMRKREYNLSGIRGYATYNSPGSKPFQTDEYFFEDLEDEIRKVLMKMEAAVNVGDFSSRKTSTKDNDSIINFKLKGDKESNWQIVVRKLTGDNLGI